MQTDIERLFLDEPKKWVDDLPKFQRVHIGTLLAKGNNFDQVAEKWLTVSAADTFRFSAAPGAVKKEGFLDNVRKEIRSFLCGDKKYAKEREGLFGQNSPTRTYVISAIAVAISSHISVAATVISPIVALVLAGLGKITLNAWCATTTEVATPSPVVAGKHRL